MARKTVTVIGNEGAYRLLGEGRVADGFWSRLVGLMGKQSLGPGEGVLIHPCSSVHTWFMRMAIDVVYVSDAHRVVGVDRALKPWRIGTLQRGVRYVIEVAAHGADAVQPGDGLTLTGWAPRGLFQRIARALRG